MLNHEPFEKTLQKLQLITKKKSVPLFGGVHSKNYRGSSFEFLQYREYSQGDELKSLDWKLWGRTDKYFIKETYSLSNEIFYFILDNSASMNYPSADKTEIASTKFSFAKYIIASLSYLLISQKDNIAFGVSNESENIHFYRNKGSFPRLLSLLNQLEVSGQDYPLLKIPQIAPQLKRHASLFIVSDFLFSLKDAEKLINYLKRLPNETILLQIFHPDEANFNFEGEVLFSHLEEKGKKKLVDIQNIREKYLQNYHNHFKLVKELENRENIIFYPMNCQKDIIKSIIELLWYYNQIGSKKNGI